MRIATTEMPATWYAVSRKRGDANFVIIDRDKVGTGTTDLTGTLLDYSNLSNVEARSYSSTPMLCKTCLASNSSRWKL